MSVSDFLFPKFCLGCKRSSTYLCPLCIASVPYADTNCPVCNRFSVCGKTHTQCTSNTSIDGLIPIWRHTGIVRKGITTMKYRFAHEIAKELGEYATVELSKFPILGNALLLSVPLHNYRKNWRGFNQSDLLAQQLASLLHFPFLPNGLLRKEPTVQQTTLKRTARRKNMVGKISVNRLILTPAFMSHTIFIVDDVWTTGATLKEATRALKSAGAQEVWGIAIAKA